jgi:hypothetical protein
MHTVVVYESLTGTTRVVAGEIARVAWAYGEVRLLAHDEAGPATLSDADLVLVGGPTHPRGATWATTGQLALARLGQRFGPPADRADECPGLQRFFARLGTVERIPAAAFDTRLDGVGVITGRASLGIARQLRRHGFDEVAAPRSFLVDGDGHLCEGQRRRAQEWAESVLGAAAGARPSRVRSVSTG